MLDGASAFGVPQPGQGNSPPGTLAPNSGPQCSCQVQQLALLSFCWESCKTEVALLSSTGTWKSCCFSQCRGRQQIPPKAQGSSTYSRGAGLLYPVQSPFPSSSTSSKGKHNSNTLLTSLDRKKTALKYLHNKLSYQEE